MPARSVVILAGLLAASPVWLLAQQPVPQPFPRPGGTSQGTPVAPPRPSPPPAQPGVKAPAQPSPAAKPADRTAAPTEATLGLPIYPVAVFLGSYDAGRGQRYYLFGSTAGFEAVVAYYRGVLKDKGDLVFEEPPTHMFEVGKFREETMAFPPGITVKDFTYGGSPGYLNPKPGAQPARFPTVIQIVPAPNAGAQ